MNAAQVLKVSSSASPEEIKRAFKRALLENHPDTAKGQPKYTIDEINKAYQRLLDTSPATLDASVQFTEVCDLSELDFDEKLEAFSKLCRCGQNITLLVTDLEANGDADEIAVQCSGCSLWVLVQYEMEED